MIVSIMNGSEDIPSTGQDSHRKSRVVPFAVTPTGVMPLYQATGVKGYSKPEIEATYDASTKFARADMGHWFHTRCDIGMGRLLLLTHSVWEPGSQMPELYHVLLRVDQDAPLVQIVYEPQHHSIATMSQITTEGRFEVLSKFADYDEEGINIPSQQMAALSEHFSCEEDEVSLSCYLDEGMDAPVSIVEISEGAKKLVKIKREKTTGKIKTRKLRHIKVHKRRA